eukprot:gnl/MRDRNA2_/MRDRNA2_96272_c0_seq1.p1 gnl/MRDRNA2_/MRDRNA2_96272_c0~~gnl/MRDRNA2_/MRDRNA2_96272_c0_seq1.p1  ORF type:complete len:132 (+),score=32.23 gnl/MRDRNA2_/MRDRNA2_96272_c0_seq1:72-467(+)
MAFRLFRPARLPVGFLQAWAFVILSATFLVGFARFWTFMVIELPQDLGPYSQMSSLSMFMHRAFPMRETNDVSFEYKLDHILIMAIVLVLLMQSWPKSKTEHQEDGNKKVKKSNKKIKEYMKSKVKGEKES